MIIGVLDSNVWFYRTLTEVLLTLYEVRACVLVWSPTIMSEVKKHAPACVFGSSCAPKH